jgi:two-component system cell cycle response regulator
MKTILIIDDSRLIREMLKDVLEPAGYRLVEAENGKQAIAQARGHRPDLIIIDIVMPHMDGIDATRILSRTTETARIPIIILTSRTSTADIKSALEAGAVDYITKPFDGVELLGRVNSALKIKEFADQIRSLKLRFKEIMSTDDLTGLKNAVCFWDYLGRTARKMTKKGGQLSLVIVDLDSFKTVNNSFGHLYGDEVLREAARILKEAIGTEGLVARYGGEEFVAVLPNTDEERAFIVAERMRCALGEHEFSRDGKTFFLSASCGVAATAIGPHHEPNEPILLFERADRALYEAKTSGKAMTVIARRTGSESSR